MIIRPYVFDFLFYLVIFMAGLDFTLSGVKVLRLNRGAHIRSKLLGILIIQWMQSGMEKWQGNNKIVRFIWGLRVMAIYVLLGGILLLMASLLMLWEISKQF